jgi:CBS domain-containing protein
MDRGPLTAGTRRGARGLLARDVMTARPITVPPDASVIDIARILLDHGVSAVPVLEGGRVVGIVSEGDLMRRTETGTDHRRSWWLKLFTGSAALARDYARSHGERAADVMTTSVVTVTPETPLHEIAGLLEERRIKRVPVVRKGTLVGIVSRADLLRAFAMTPVPKAPTLAASDHEIRDALLRQLEAAEWATPAHINPIVVDGVVQLWGLIGSEEERRAVRVMAERIGGVRAVEDHLRRGPG